MPTESLYGKYRHKMRQIADLNYAMGLLHWDQEVYMPPKGSPSRASQLSTLAGLAHEMSVSGEMEDLLLRLKEDRALDDVQRGNVAKSVRSLERSKKLNPDFVREFSSSVSQAFQAWAEARENNDFSAFQPSLQKLVDLTRQKCEMVGYGGHPYDALIDEYEPGAKTAEINTLFGEVREKLVAFRKRLEGAPQPDDSHLYLHYDRDVQWQFGLDLLRQMGYDFERGRQDISAHPFTAGFGANDVRVTTRIDETNLAEMVWSCIHEGGHALYEQGLLVAQYGLPAGIARSLGLHESQSRLWENNVGRSRAYWQANYGKLQSLFPQNLGKVSLDGFYKSINKVEPGLIRTSADEVTYHFHILVRFEIEKALVEGSVKVAELPDVWNEKYKEYLGVDVPSDAQGVLQDIHWSHGSFGYFPTYSLGSFYAAQMYRKAQSALPDLEGQVAAGNLMPLLQWLRTNVHQYGQLYDADELCQKITGEKLNFGYFMDYIEQKYGAIYNL